MTAPTAVGAPTILRLDQPVAAASLNRSGTVLAVGLGDGGLYRLPLTGPAQPGLTVPAHDGAVLVLCPDGGDGFLSGGDDGRVVALAAHGAIRPLWHRPGRWIDALAAAPGGGFAVAIGRHVLRLTADGHPAGPVHDGPSTVADLAFGPAGAGLAVAHYGGITLLPLPPVTDAPRRLDWRGSHVALSWSPDGRFLVSATQDSELHVWCLADGQDMQMAGFGTKPRGLSWQRHGHWLACSGADGVVLLPFAGAGPFGRRPRELAPERRVLVTAVACDPAADRVAFGYRDGLVAITDLAGRMADTLVPADGEPVLTLAWTATGTLVAVGEGGRISLCQPPRPGPLAALRALTRRWRPG